MAKLLLVILLFSSADFFADLSGAVQIGRASQRRKLKARPKVKNDNPFRKSKEEFCRGEPVCQCKGHADAIVDGKAKCGAKCKTENCPCGKID